MRLVGYARASTNDQETRLQRDALRKAGAERVYEEKASAVAKRPELERCLANMRPGDVLVVWKLDRLARSLRDLLTILERLHAAGAGIRSLTEPVDTATPAGMLMVTGTMTAPGTSSAAAARPSSAAMRCCGFHRWSVPLGLSRRPACVGTACTPPTLMRSGGNASAVRGPPSPTAKTSSVPSEASPHAAAAMCPTSRTDSTPGHRSTPITARMGSSLP